MSEIQSFINAINGTLKNIKTKIELSKKNEYYFSEHCTNLLFIDLHYHVKSALKIIFGNIHDENYGLFNNIFQTENHLPKFDKGVMFSYWSWHNVPYNSSKEEDGKWRDNFFYKGTRFSNENAKANFYKPFNVISEHCKTKDGESNVPIDFFVRHIQNAKKNNNNFQTSYLVFVPASIASSDPEAIYLPIKESFEKETYFTENIKKLFGEIEKIKISKEKCYTETERSQLENNTREILSSYFEKAFRQIEEENDSLIHKLFQQLKTKLQYSDEIPFSLEDVFSMVVCYQLYDHEGITYLYLPDNNKVFCCLGILIPIYNEPKIREQHNHLITIVNLLAGIPVLEKDVFEIVKKNIPLKQVWKLHYLANAPLYENLCSHICILLKYICRKNKIKVLDITSRVKEFDSFYKRAVDRYNDPGKFKIENSIEIQEYRRHFISGSPESARVVFSKFWDLSGVRVLCVFKDDMDEIKNLLSKNNPNVLGNIKEPYTNDEYGLKINYFDKMSANEYRAEHYILRLAEKRTELVELDELKDILCEVQVKTVLSQGWSDADHDLFYKSNLPPSKLEEILPEDNTDIGEHRGMTSRQLKLIDDKFVEIKNVVKKIIDGIYN